MLEILTNLEFKHYGAIGLLGYAFWVVRFRKPSIYGGFFSLFCVYLPLANKIPITIFPGINRVNVFFLILLFLSSGRKIEKSKQAFDGVWKYGVLWIFICTFSTFLVLIIYPDSFSDSIVQLKRWIDPIIIYYFGRKLVSEADRAAATDGIAIGFGLFSLHLALQGMDLGDSMRVGGAMGDINAAGAFVAAYSSVIIALLARSTSTLIGFFSFISLLVIGIIAEIQTVSRSGILGLGLAILVAGFFSRNFFIKCGMVLLFIIPFFTFSLLPDKLIARFEGEDMNRSGDSEAQISSENRFRIWSGAIKMTFSNPLGVGMDRFKKEIGNYGGLPGRDAHNAYLLIAAENGFAGLIIFLLLLWHLLKRGWNSMALSNDKNSQIAGLALFSAILALAFMNFFSVTMRDANVFGYCWILAAIAYNKTGLQPKSFTNRFQ